MNTYHIHIKGIVQGVGFRPFVYQLARKKAIKGWVNNTNDGVHIHINTSDKEKATDFLNELLQKLPPLAVVTDTFLKEIEFCEYSSFDIVKSNSQVQPNLLLTPDVALCKDCAREIFDKNNRRYGYPFTTCTNCGPRYSIISELPYDRPNTTMHPFNMCETCQIEYDNPLERRHFSQTNSCAACRVEMQLFEKGKRIENFTDLDYIVSKWKEGKIIALKGIGGYLLTCDATNKQSVQRLRDRKQRPKKPFALMYPSIEVIQKDAFINTLESKELESIQAPIVLLETKPKGSTGIAQKEINSHLQRIGVMLPYTPLYQLLLQKYKKPIVATSGNITDSTIIYTDKKALENLTQIADIILLNNREIVLPQDDGVVQFTKKHQHKITLRRSRGKAPTYINQNLQLPNKTVFAAGSMLKSTFGLLTNQNTYISQYLGNTSSYEAQLNYETTYRHFKKIFQLQIDTVVVDKHPDYFATRFGKELAREQKADLVELQHHKAHFYSVLGENNLLACKEAVLGVIWDGTGLGEDGSIWGGEFFTYHNRKVERIAHIGEFDFILADKMVKEPRISALAILFDIEGSEMFLQKKFTATEWKIYTKLLQNNKLKSTSMGRFFDAVSALLFDNDRHAFEAEASMRLEQAASDYYYNNHLSLKDSYLYKAVMPKNCVSFLSKCIINDLKQNIDKQLIAARFHISLVDCIIKIAQQNQMDKIAFSGGVFQNALLVDIVYDLMDTNFQLYFQKEFSPNDEGIPFGQLMYICNLT